MFHIPTVLGRSPIHGMGVFTREPIPAGTVIWSFDPYVDWELTEAEFKALPEPMRLRLLPYVYQERPGAYILCGDNGKYMNHDPDPNCDDDGRTVRAKRDIAAGEELTCDYRQFDLMSRNGHEGDAVAGAEPPPHFDACVGALNSA